MKHIPKLLGVLCAYLVLSAVGGVLLSEASLHLRRLPLRHAQQFATFVHDRYGAELQNVEIHSADAVVLKAWYVEPPHFNGNAVILLHGITDNREGVAGYGRIFLDHGYAILLPDARDHGESGGEIATYGIREADDVHQWISWLYRRDSGRLGCVYGFGESYGAALVLQSLAVEPRYCAVAVESSYATAREMSYERVSAPFHLRPWFGRTLGEPVIEFALLYSKLRYGLDLLKPSPLDGIKHSRVPVLLIHGLDDRSISPHHAEILAQAAPDRVQLWLVPHAGHTMAWASDHQAFETRVLGWFEDHRKAAMPLKSALPSSASRPGQ
jgi:uncharacterized protein